MILNRVSGRQKGAIVGRVSLSITPSWLQKIEMFKVQFAYGQREILTDYMGLDRSTLFLGVLQHGFTFNDVPSDANTPRLKMLQRTPLWVYSEDRAKSLQELGFSNVSSIGAPWLYLPKTSISRESKIGVEQYIVFPIHTSLSVAVSPSDEDIRKKIKYWKGIAGENALTICLYWSDFLEMSWRRIAQEEGVEVTLVGVGETDPVWSPHTTRVNFLTNLRDLLSQNTHAIFETFTSGMMYAISVGLSVGYFPQTHTDYESQLHDHTVGGQWMEENIPGVIGKFVSAKDLAKRNDRMLGVQSFRSPQELRNILVHEDGIVPIS